MTTTVEARLDPRAACALRKAAGIIRYCDNPDCCDELPPERD